MTQAVHLLLHSSRTKTLLEPWSPVVNDSWVALGPPGSCSGRVLPVVRGHMPPVPAEGRFERIDAHKDTLEAGSPPQ